MRPSYRPDIPPQPQPYRTQILDHLGLVAGMFEELGITEVIDKATQQDPEMRIVTAGHAVWALSTNRSTLSLVFSSISRSLVSLLQAFKPAISMMTPSGVPWIHSTTMG